MLWGLAMADARIRVKLGHIEVEYEGDASFLENELLATVGELLELQKKHPMITLPIREAPTPPPKGSANSFDHTTDTVATLTNANTGPELVIAAVGRLTLVQQQPSSTRKQIFEEMRSATSHYKRSYQNNLSGYLSGLTSKGRLRLVGKDTYALSKKEREKLEVVVADNQ